METLHIDLIGPFPRSKNGHTLILTIVDGFSRFSNLVPLRKGTATAIVKALQGRHFSIFGLPTYIVSDNAAVFQSSTFLNLCFTSGIRHIRQSPYYPKGNLVERVHRNLKYMSISYHNQAHNTWDEHLADFQQALNSAFHASIGSSPAEIFRGRNLTQPIKLHWDIEDDTAKPDLRARWAAARKTLLKTQRETATRYNKGRQQ
jgi:hypothetical protein